MFLSQNHWLAHYLTQHLTYLHSILFPSDSAAEVYEENQEQLSMQNSQICCLKEEIYTLKWFVVYNLFIAYLAIAAISLARFLIFSLLSSLKTCDRTVCVNFW